MFIKCALESMTWGIFKGKGGLLSENVWIYSSSIAICWRTSFRSKIVAVILMHSFKNIDNGKDKINLVSCICGMSLNH
jgi:hypothetical protein